MTNSHFANSILHLKACENLEKTILKDLEIPQGQSIAKLFNDQKNNKKNDETTETIETTEEIENNPQQSL